MTRQADPRMWVVGFSVLEGVGFSGLRGLGFRLVGVEAVCHFWSLLDLVSVWRPARLRVHQGLRLDL